MESKYTNNQLLEPNVPFTTNPAFVGNIDFNSYPFKIQARSGNCTILSVADLYPDYDLNHRVFVWFKPIQITVLPEFGSSAIMIASVGIIGVVLIQKRMRS